MTTPAKPIKLPTHAPAEGQGNSLLSATQAMPFVGNLKVKLTARLGETEMSVSDLLSLKAGSTIDLTRPLDQPIELLAEGHVIAHGTLVAVDDCFGLRLTSAPKMA